MKHISQSKMSLSELRKYLPSKKTSYIMIGGLTLLGAIYIISGLSAVNYQSKNGKVVTVSDAIAKDSDGDGVADWEESLWGTNPNNPDSDGDGVPDGTEITQRKEQLALANGYGSSTVSLNETDKFSRDLFITYSALSQEGSLSSDAAGKLANAAIAKSFNNIPTVPTYSRTDVKLTTSTAVNDQAYRDAITKKSSVGGGKLGTEFPLIINGVENGDVASLKLAAKNATVYNMYIQELLKLSVPESQADNHVRLLNDLSYIATTLPQMESLENDVIKGYPLYTVYTKAYQDMFMTFEAIGKNKIQ